MVLEGYEFKIDHRSSFYIGQLLAIIMFCTLIIGFVIYQVYVMALICSGILAYFLYYFISRSDLLLINDRFIQYDRTIEWNDIEQVQFTCSTGRNFRDTWILIKTKSQNKESIIHSKLYENSRELRTLFEKICVEKGIKYAVTDRGLY